MRILIVSHYFPPEVGAPQTRLSEFARAWASGGDEVTVLTGFPNHPTGVIPPAYRGKTRMTEEVDGYRVVRTWVYATPNERVLRKTLGHLSFMVSSVLLGLRRSGPADVVIVSSPTFFSILSAWLMARIKRATFVVEVRDLWPAAIVQVGLLRRGLLVRILEWIELACYRAAALVVPTSDGFARDIVSRGIDSDKVRVVTNGVQVERFAAPSGAQEARDRLGALKDHVLVLYAGTHGMLYSLNLVAEAAGALSNEHAHFAFVGEGVGKAGLADHVRDLGLKNVTLLPSVPSNEIPAVMGAGDICLLPLRDNPIVDVMIFAKIFEYMAAGKPVVACVRGETADILKEAGAVVLPPGDRNALVSALRELIHDPARREEMGQKALTFVRNHYDRGVLSRRYRTLLDAAAGHQR